MKANYCLPLHFDFFFDSSYSDEVESWGKTQDAVGVLTLAPGKQRSLYSAGLPGKSFELMSSIIR